MRFFIIIMLFLTSNIFAQNISIGNVRSLFLKSAKDEKLCKELVVLLADFNDLKNPILAAYQACGTMIMASYLINPINKWQHFSNGKTLLEKCVNAEKENVEIRFLRFSIQSKSPSFLKYNSELQKDKIFILNNLSELKDLQLKQIIVSFLKKSNQLTLAEKQILDSK